MSRSQLVQPFLFLMFGYYKNGVKQKEYTSVYDITSLIENIKNNPLKGEIIKLRSFKYGSGEYSRLKETLPTITPHALFRNAKTIDNLVQLSGYLYFDIDGNSIGQDIHAYKQMLINEYNEYIHLAGLSVGGNGLFFYMKVRGLTVENFKAVYEHYRTVIFKNLPIDNNAKGLARNQFIPLDEQLYYNPSCLIAVPNDLIDTETNNSTKKKGTFNVKDKKERCYTLNVPFLPIYQLREELKFETEVSVEDSLFIIEPIDYHKVYFPKTYTRWKETCDIQNDYTSLDAA